MKKSKFLIMAFAAASLLFSCAVPEPDDPNDPTYQPTEAEKNMVTSPMSWTLDSVLVITNYKEADESSQMYTKADNILTWTYHFYPSSYQFPTDLVFVSEMDGSKIKMSKEYNQDYCKYTCESDGEIIAAGYLCYYTNASGNEYFAMNGTKFGGWVEFRIVEAELPSPDADVWTLAFDASADEDHVYERQIEYYSQVK